MLLYSVLQKMYPFFKVHIVEAFEYISIFLYCIRNFILFNLVAFHYFLGIINWSIKISRMKGDRNSNFSKNLSKQRNTRSMISQLEMDSKFIDAAI